MAAPLRAADLAPWPLMPLALAGEPVQPPHSTQPGRAHVCSNTEAGELPAQGPGLESDPQVSTGA